MENKSFEKNRSGKKGQYVFVILNGRIKIMPFTNQFESKLYHIQKNHIIIITMVLMIKKNCLL